MTCIAWDGDTLAADKRTNLANMAHTTTKIVMAGNGSLVGAAGDSGMCRTLRAWYCNGADPEKYPDKNGKCDMVVITPEREILLYQSGPHPIHIENRFFATGSGRDFAIAAMHMGRTAVEAVEMACLFDVNTGDGIDALGFAPALRVE